METMGSAGAGVGDDGLEGVIGVEPLKEQIPESDQRGEKTLVKGERLERREQQESAAWQELEEKLQQREPR
jgi:hypothetical protein